MTDRNKQHLGPLLFETVGGTFTVEVSDDELIVTPEGDDPTTYELTEDASRLFRNHILDLRLASITAVALTVDGETLGELLA